MAVSRHHLKTTKISRKGQITISSDARQQLGIEPGANLIEIVIGNCVVYMTQDEVFEDIVQRASDVLATAGITVDKLKTGIEKRQEQRLKDRYPDLYHG